MRKSSFWVPLLFGCLLASAVREGNAQGTLDAQTISGISVVGYTPSGGVGWAFVPTADILVTGIEASAPQLSFWQGPNQVLATFAVSSPSAIPADSFTPIAPLFLSAGQLYLVSCQNPNFSGEVLVTVWARPGTGSLPPYGPAPFYTSSYISQFASYYVSQDQQWSSTTTPPSSNNDFLLYGPNFQFQVVPEPSTIGLSILGFLFCTRRLKHRRKVEMSI